MVWSSLNVSHIVMYVVAVLFLTVKAVNLVITTQIIAATIMLQMCECNYLLSALPLTRNRNPVRLSE